MFDPVTDTGASGDMTCIIASDTGMDDRVTEDGADVASDASVDRGTTGDGTCVVGAIGTAAVTTGDAT